MTLFTKDQTMQALAKVCMDNPDKVNPMGVDRDGEPSCLYDDGFGNRCIGGEVVFEMTGTSIDAGNFDALIVVIDALALPFERDAAALLGFAQRTADNFSESDEDGDQPHPRPWGEVLTIIEQENQ